MKKNLLRTLFLILVVIVAAAYSHRQGKKITISNSSGQGFQFKKFVNSFNTSLR
jgi:hypothetical protein